MGGHACACRDDGVSFHNITLTAKTCDIGWDAVNFCRIIGDGGILFVGDSTMQIMASVVMNHVILHYQHRKYGNVENSVHASNCAKRIRFGHSDTLVLHPAERGAPMYDYVEYLLPRFVVVSTGPHIQILDEFENIVTNVTEQIKYFRNTTTFIWRTQFAAGCSDNHILYNWKLFDAFDEIAKSRWNGNILNVSVFKHVKHMHVCDRGGLQDGMHYCVPGPLDAIPGLLYTLLSSL